jgi:hypothetical protein
MLTTMARALGLAGAFFLDHIGEMGRWRQHGKRGGSSSAARGRRQQHCERRQQR